MQMENLPTFTSGHAVGTSALSLDFGQGSTGLWQGFWPFDRALVYVY